MSAGRVGAGAAAAAVPQASVAELIGWRMRALGLAPGSGAGGGSADGAVAARGAGSGRPSDTCTGDADGIAAVASHLLAMQGQDWNAVRWALGLRAPGSTLSDLHDAFADGRLVRSWPMRGTVHVVAAADIGWMQQATNHRILPGAAKRRAFIGLDDASLARMTDIAIAELTGGRQLSRNELIAAWERAGIEVPGPWRYHVIWWLCQNQILVQGPVAESEPLLVLADEWITAPRSLSGDEALAELAARFAGGRGPVLEKDLAWWTGLTIREARHAIAVAHSEGRITPVDVDLAGGAGATRHWADPALLDATSASEAAAIAASSPALLLPGFDEHLLGYTERGAVLDAEHFGRIVPGKNGVFRGTVVTRGRVVGTWQRTLPKTASQSAARIEATPFPGHTIDADSLAAPVAAWSGFHEMPAELSIAEARG